MDLQSTVTLVGFAGFAVTLFGYLATMKRDLRGEMRDIAAGIVRESNIRFDAVDARFESVDRRFDAVDARFEAVNRRFDAIDARFEAVDRRFQAGDDRFAQIQATMDARFAQMQSSMDARFDGLDRRVDDLRDDLRAGLSAVDHRLVTLEQRTFDIGAHRPSGTR